MPRTPATFSKTCSQQGRKTGQGASAPCGGGGAAEAPPRRRPPCPQAQTARAFRESPRIRETAHPAAKEQTKAAHSHRQGRDSRNGCLFFVLVFFCAAPSFSLPRKKQRGPEGVSEFPPLTATPSGLPPPCLGCRGIESHSPQGPRGGAMLPGLCFGGRCGGPLYGCPPLLELRRHLRMVP